MKLNIVKCLLALSVVLFSSCDEDFVELKSDIKGAQNFTIQKEDFPVVAYTEFLGPVQTNTFSNNLLGIHKDDVYGKVTTANIVTQLTSSTYDLDLNSIDDNLESVHLYIPYYSNKTGTDSNDKGTYTLDSIIGDVNETFKLSVYESKYVLRTLDPNTNFEEAQAYYSSAYTDLNLSAQEGELLYEDANFKVSDSFIEDQNNEELSPGIFVDLFDTPARKTFWNNLILATTEGGSTPLDTQDDFRKALRGLIIKAEGSKGHLITLNLAGASVKIDYKTKEEKILEADPAYVEDITNRTEFSLNLSGVKLNSVEDDTAITTTGGDTANGDDNLYLRGFNGAAAVIDMFGNIDADSNGKVDALEEFQSHKDDWIINQASLTFYVDHSKFVNSDAEEPNRVILYDLKNNVPILDFFLDGSSGGPSLDKAFYSQPLTKDNSGKGIKYTMNISQHVNNLLKLDSTNTKLGLFATKNITDVTSFKLKNETASSVVKSVPQGAAINERGTVLYGSKSTVPADKRLTFEIYYTKEN